MRSVALAALFVCNVLISSKHSLAADGRGWEYEQYKIHALIALDLPGRLSGQLEKELPAYLAGRVRAAIEPFWSFDVKVVNQALRSKILRDVESASEPTQDGLPTDGDKLLLLAVTRSPTGYTVTAREFDRLVARWSMPIRQETQQLETVPELLFALASKTIAPLAHLEVDVKDFARAELVPRGALLPRRAGMEAVAKKGDFFVPILRRTSRAGQLVEGGIQAVPWTFVEVTEVKPDRIAGKIQSANRRPFGARRQGRVEQIAIALRADPAATTLQLRSRIAKEKPLVGYDVFVGSADGEKLDRLGDTDSAGRLEIPVGKAPLQYLFVKHGGQLLARFPVVAGAERKIEVPLPDDDARLAAEARLAAMREDLIDVVARRNILMARTRQKIKKKDFAGAQELLRDLDELPSRSQFDLKLEASERQLHSDDPQMQRRIKQLFDATKTLMAQFLDLQAVSKLHEEVREAQQKGT